MPTLACRICGRVVYTTVPLEALLPEERRCPRCGAVLVAERRTVNRRRTERRAQPPDAPGPPPDTAERRIVDRRVIHRRRDGKPLG